MRSYGEPKQVIIVLRFRAPPNTDMTMRKACCQAKLCCGEREAIRARCPCRNCALLVTSLLQADRSESNTDGGASGHFVAFADIFVKGVVTVVPINLIVPWGVLAAYAPSRRLIASNTAELRDSLADLSFYKTLGPFKKGFRSACYRTICPSQFLPSRCCALLDCYPTAGCYASEQRLRVAA